MGISSRTVELDAGVLELVVLGKDRLALAKMVMGETTQNEVLHRLAANGVQSGYLEDGITHLVEGGKEQVPVAASHIIRVPGKSTMPLYDVPLPATAGDWEVWEGAPLNKTVQSGDPLVLVEEPPHIVKMSVGGARKELSRGESIDASEFAGKGTEVNDENSAVLAAKDGYAHRGLFGVVEIAEVEELPALARSHGKVQKDGAVIIHAEISERAEGVFGGSLMANDHVIGATLNIGGNLYVDGDIKADSKKYSNHIITGQSVRAQSISDATIWAGGDVHIQRIAKDVQIHCLGNAVMNTLDGGEVRVANRFIAHEVLSGSAIFLGARHIEIKELNNVELSLAQLSGRLTDNEAGMVSAKQDYERSKERLLHEIERMRNQRLSGALRQKAIQAVQRHLEMMSDAIERLENGLTDYEASYKMVAIDRVRINYCRDRLNFLATPEAIITGKIDPGVIVHGPGEMLELKGGLENVRIVPDPFTGKPEIHSR